MALLSEDEKRALRQREGLLYSSGQFPLLGNTSGRSRRARGRVSPVRAIVGGLVVGLLALVALVVFLTKAARAEPLPSAGSPQGSEVRAAGAVSLQHHGEGDDAEQ